MTKYRRKTNTWMNEIRRLGRDFCLDMNVVERHIEHTKNLNTDKIPGYYCGNINNYLYDQCYLKIRPMIMAKYKD